MLKFASALALAVVLAACSSGPPRIPTKVIDRALASAGTTGLAQPGRIVATESAFARAAREGGQWSAFREFAAPGALVHGPAGPVDAAAWLRGRSNPAAAMRWAPRDVWMSCDATLAVSQGRFKDAAGLVGNYLTVWQRQGDGAYRWAYHTAAADNPQPPPRADQTPAEDEIVVLAMEVIKGTVADCTPRPASAAPGGDPALLAQGTARDGSLHWQARPGPGSAHRVAVSLNRAGGWEQVLDIAFNPG